MSRALQEDTRVGGVRKLYFAAPGEQLVRVPDSVRKCVAFLAYQSTSYGDGEVCAGTAFFVGIERPPKSPAQSDGGVDAFVYLVTAAHVIEGLVKKGVSEIIVRVNNTSGGIRRIVVAPDRWMFHPTDAANDVAAMAWLAGEPDGLDMRVVVPGRSAATPAVMEKVGIGIGDEVFMTGLYTKHRGEERNTPIVRVGNLAAMPEEPCDTSRGPAEAYLVEIRSIGGISGSPVFVRGMPVPKVNAQAGQFIFGQPPAHYLLGLMHGRWDMRQIAPIMFEIDADFLRQPLNSGIGVVVPVEKIIETLNHPTFVAQRTAADESRRQQDETSTE